jgi:peptide/nickel transport system permease protein
MARFIVRRLLLLIPILFGLSVLLFAWVRALPGSPAEALLGERATPETIAAVRRLYGLDEPLIVQYWAYVKRSASFDFGTSTRTNRPVTEEFLLRFPATVELSIVALVFAVGVGIPLGYYAARKYGTWLDSTAVIGSLIGVTIPVFFLGFLLRQIFAIELGWLPATGRQNNREIGTEHPTGFFVLDGLVQGDLGQAWEALTYLILPGLALGTIPLAIITRITRASVLDVVNEDYVRTAEAKGLLRPTISRRHILRNALLPVVTIIGLQLGLLLSGAILTETVFAFPGVGSFVADAIRFRDYSVIQGFILVFAVLYVLVNLLVDLAYGLIDPRVRVR